jgi:serine/threonine protein kinase
MLSVGDVVSDRYRIDAVLGEGGMGIVYRAEHLHLRKPHALKVLLGEWSTMPEVVARFEREAIASGNIQSPHVVAATDFGRLPDGAFFLVMEYVRGRTLREALDGGALPPARAVHILQGVLEALHAAHSLAVVHRDLKPENIMLVDRDGDPDFVKVLDFGIAKVDGAAPAGAAAPMQALTKAGAIIGTLEYMSPEQALGQPIDARSDLYSAGVILFEMLTGSCPFAGGAATVLRQHVMGDIPKLPAPIVAGIDPRIAAVLDRLLATSAENRFASAAEVLSVLSEDSRQTPGVLPVRRLRDGSGETRSSLVEGRVRAAMLAGLKTLEGVARRTVANPRALLEHPKRHPIAAGAIIAGVAIALAASWLAHPAVPRASAMVAVPAPSTSRVTPGPSSAPSQRPVQVADLPPPPGPVDSGGTRPGATSTPKGSSHNTGPGGIYIPPPSQWFK